ncbi:DUF1836 domain-containing protein [Companilactobacillus zhachilii]|jgi:Domain of unknown function (DUF1836).|uniref:DUF1836 domain-containing protein n=1 Tax=Companilactobacillus zhachilii TaxID=2304606 RepID=A0A386PRW7_9LACO|nr:DUF1836 domain-containing protein [Companilactobacillus zhachilii]AYE37443.1 DUF1836 domain-containing protein [Companilactobacillus zhachilii]MBL3530965.1 DUF1836 domain-containing protein [Companilactobacillus zhachilii]
MDELQVWLDKMEDYRLPRFDELPELDLYRDQLLTLVDKYIGPVWLEDGPVVTTSMVNNYVKNGLMPHPEKKRYTREHLAYLIAITFLKQVVSISEIQEGLDVQTKLNGGIAKAYDFFCEKQELALKMLNHREEGQVLSEKNQSAAYLLVEMVTIAFATKLITKKILMIETHNLDEKS